MKKSLYKIFVSALLAGSISLTGCVDDLDSGMESADKSGYLTFGFAISNAATRGSTEINGEKDYHENSIHTLDLYFYYNDDTDDDTPSALHIHKSGLSGVETEVPISSLKDILNPEGETAFKVVAVANCSATNNKDNKSINELKQLTITQELFRGSGKNDEEIEDFVMTNFNDISANVTVDPKRDKNDCTLTFRRVAAKIRVALDVAPSLEDNEATWTPDLEDMRLFISNGVKTSRLDGDMTDRILIDKDYYSIETTGSKYDPDPEYQGQLTESYNMSREIKEHDAPGSGNKINDDNYKYYNDIPLYTYPNRWKDSMLDNGNKQTTLTIVVPWKIKDASDEVDVTYKPCYYSIPVTTTVDKDGYINIESNAYYYIRAYIGMMGSETPLNPLEVEAECEIANWGTANETGADIRPLRFLQFNQTAFNVYNEKEISIPFYSSHNCTLIDLKGRFYIYNTNSGVETERTFDRTVSKDNNTNGSGFKKNGFFFCDINNLNNTVNFWHDFFSIWYVPNSYYSSSQLNRVDGPYTTQNTASRHKFYSRFEIELTVRHSDLLNEESTEYEETIYLTFYPAIYITTEKIEGKAYTDYDGWIFVNGYARGDGEEAMRNTGMLGHVGHNPGNESSVMTTITLTQLDEEYKDKWTIGDPRMRHINNELDFESMKSDSEDHLNIWNISRPSTSAPASYRGNFGGPYDGTSTSGANTGNNYTTNRHTEGSANSCKTIWEEYNNPSLIIPWTGDGITQWVAKEDYWSNEPNTPQYHRTLSYYYPTLETEDTKDMIAPKFTMTSMHAYSTGNAYFTKDIARRRCATFQQYGYPAGRWRLPTQAEIAYVKELQSRNILVNVFGGSSNWSAHGEVNGSGSLTGSNSESTTSYIRCIYDTWFWEQLDEDGVSYNRIPDPDGSHDNWKIFHWGDRPKENTLIDPSTDDVTTEGEKYTVKRFLNSQKGIKPVKK